MISEKVQDFIEHYGVMGQKWGVRRASGSTTHAPSQDSTAAKDLRKKPLHSLSNQELKTVTERQRLEQSFKQMNPTKIASGKKKATEILATIGVLTTAYTMSTKATKIGKDFLAKKQLLKVTKLLSTSGPG
jgi:hypothetical protein